MRKSAVIRVAVFAVFVVGAVALSAVPSQAHGFRGGHFHGGLAIGLGPWWGPWYPSPYYVAPRVVVEPPPVYIQPAPPPEASWYFCPSENAYYPYVQSCREPWVRVPARSQ
jgi:hypothetical protein